VNIEAGEYIAQTVAVGTISECQWGPIGDRWATLTEKNLIAAGTARIPTNVIKIPMGAKRLTIYQGAQGTPGVFDFIPGIAFEVGTAPVPIPRYGLSSAQVAVSPVSRHSEKVDVPGDASHIVIANPDPLAERAFTYLFDLEF